MVVYRERYVIDTNSSQLSAKVSGRYQYLHFTSDEYPQVGDYVLFHKASEDFAIIEDICERKTVLERLDVSKSQTKQVLACNMDLVFICLSLNEDFNITKLKNFLSLADGDYLTVILLTKSDLCDNQDDYIEEVKEVTDKEIYPVSIFNHEDIMKLRLLMQDKTSVFIGSSGVGKSSLINSLFGSELFKTNDIRLSDAQGRHTTVNRELVNLDQTTKVIDTPGIRIISSYYVDESSFEDILALSEGCRFSDCTHQKEPGCMVKNAIKNGDLESDRLDRYNKAKKINAYNQKREADRKRIQEKQAKRR